MVNKVLIDRAVVEQALEAFEDHAKQYPHMQKGYTVDAAEALRSALAQPQVEQEPVAWIYQNSNTDKEYLVWCKSEMGGRNWRPLYLHPQPHRQPLTDDEINTIWRNSTHMTIVEVVRAIEAAHGIKEQK